MNVRYTARAGLLALLVCAIAAHPATLPAQQNQGRIEGTVSDARTKQPLVGASVFIQGARIGNQTNEHDRFILLNVPAGQYELRTRRIEFTNVARRITVANDQTMTIDFELGEAAISLDEVVVTGTAVATRAKEVPTSTDIVNAEQF